MKIAAIVFFVAATLGAQESIPKPADMVLINEDIFSIAPEKIRDARVLKTFVGGRLIFDANAPPK